MTAGRARVAAALAVLAGVLLGTVLGAGLAAGTPPAWAWWTDQAVVRSGQVAAGAVPAPVARCGTLGVASVRFDWTAVPGATQYVVHYGANGARSQTVTGTSFTTVDLVGQGTFWVTAQRQFPATTWTSVPSNRLGYTVAVVSLCG
ncbi:MAG TPA: hypothetical protein VKY86_04535 [Promicromonospora sp.]|nr:hypothetical protein [Promicromonospora sp.]